MATLKPEQFKNDKAAYTLIDSYLSGLKDAGPDELTTHLIDQTKIYNVTHGGPVLKAINVIRGLIEAQGADPDELMKKRIEEKTE
jgi:hypothetical protein